MRIMPCSLKEANAFVAAYHRHNGPSRGHKFSVKLVDLDGGTIGVAIAGRPVARGLDDGLTLEVSRTCTDGSWNANSKLYGAVVRCGVAMGYERFVTYTQAGESGASLKGAGWRVDAELAPRKNWANSGGNVKRNAELPEYVERKRWVLIRGTGL